jgi:2'-5' RNA ligase
MIKLRDLILENKPREYGCVMACIDGNQKSKILEFNKSIIGDEVIYDNKDKEFGRETDPHVTIKFGLTKHYTREEMKEFLENVSPFIINAEGVSVFENDDFDVVKMDINGEELKRLNEKFSKLPNEDEHPDYHPHCTLAYVNPGEGKQFIDKSKKFLDIEVSRIVYSDCGKKSYYDLKNSKD